MKGESGNVEEFFISNKRAGVVVIKLNERYRLKILQAYVSTASYDDEAADNFRRTSNQQ